MTDPLPPEARARLEELLAAATPGPWVADDLFAGEWDIPTITLGYGEDASGARFHEDAIGELWGSNRSEDELRANAALICEAINALPALLASHDALGARIGELEEALKEERAVKAEETAKRVLAALEAAARRPGEKEIAQDIAGQIERSFGVYLEADKPWPWDWKACYLEAAQYSARRILALFGASDNALNANQGTDNG